MQILLKYRNGITEVQQLFDAAIFQQRPTTQRAKYDSLRGRKYAFLLSKRKAYSIEIGADELQTTAKKTFMDSFYTAELQYLSLEIAVPNFFPVVIDEEGTAPISFLEDWERLPEYSLTLIASEPE